MAIGAAISAILKRKVSVSVSVSVSVPICTGVLKKGFFIRTYNNNNIRKDQNDNFFSRISHLRNPNLTILPVLDQWLQEGKNVTQPEFQRIIRELRCRKRYSHALQLSEWMSTKHLCSFSSGDLAVQLDLIGVVHGLDAAEIYFNNLTDREKDEKTYGALLNCYVREHLIDKSLSHLQKMKENGFVSSPLTYNNLMCLYSHTNQLDKIPEVLTDMKNDGVSPNNFSYRICINSYGQRSDFENMERILKEMETRPYMKMDWTTYSTVANFYIKAGLREKVMIILEKLEEAINKDALGYNHLITHYAHLGHKDEAMRVWRLQKVICKKQINRDYITMLGMLVKLGELEEAEALLEEWESTCHVYDFRVPNILLIGYCQKGMIDKAELMLRGIIEKGKTPVPNSWAILALWCLDGEKLEKAYGFMKEALAVQERNPGWRPKPRMISSLLNWVGENGEIEEVEGFVDSLKKVVEVSSEMYHALIKASIRAGREVDAVLERMKCDELDGDEETRKILGLRP